jgi:hypothetical protein
MRIQGAFDSLKARASFEESLADPSTAGELENLMWHAADWADQIAGAVDGMTDLLAPVQDSEPTAATPRSEGSTSMRQRNDRTYRRGWTNRHGGGYVELLAEFTLPVRSSPGRIELTAFDETLTLAIRLSVADARSFVRDLGSALAADYPDS